MVLFYKVASALNKKQEFHILRIIITHPSVSQAGIPLAFCNSHFDMITFSEVYSTQVCFALLPNCEAPSMQITLDMR